MRNSITAVAVVLFLAGVPLSAQELGRRISIFASGIDYQAVGASENELHGGVGIGLGYRWTPRWGVELSATVQSYRGAPVGVQPDTGLLIRDLVRSQPVDALLQYHLGGAARWKPYVTAGVHYLDARDASSSLSPQAGAGVFFGLRPGLWLKAEARYVVGNSTAYHDPAFKPSLGVSVKF